MNATSLSLFQYTIDAQSYSGKCSKPKTCVRDLLYFETDPSFGMRAGFDSERPGFLGTVSEQVAGASAGIGVLTGALALEGVNNRISSQIAVKDVVGVVDTTIDSTSRIAEIGSGAAALAYRVVKIWDTFHPITKVVPVALNIFAGLSGVQLGLAGIRSALISIWNTELLLALLKDPEKAFSTIQQRLLLSKEEIEQIVDRAKKEGLPTSHRGSFPMGILELCENNPLVAESFMQQAASIIERKKLALGRSLGGISQESLDALAKEIGFATTPEQKATCIRNIKKQLKESLFVNLIASVVLVAYVSGLMYCVSTGDWDAAWANKMMFFGSIGIGLVDFYGYVQTIRSATPSKKDKIIHRISIALLIVSAGISLGFCENLAQRDCIIGLLGFYTANAIALEAIWHRKNKKLQHTANKAALAI